MSATETADPNRRDFLYIATGAAGVVGVAAICAKLEDLAHTDRLARAPALVRDLETECDRAVRHLSGLTTRMPGGGS